MFCAAGGYIYSIFSKSKHKSIIMIIYRWIEGMKDEKQQTDVHYRYAYSCCNCYKIFQLVLLRIVSIFVSHTIEHIPTITAFTHSMHNDIYVLYA